MSSRQIMRDFVKTFPWYEWLISVNAILDQLQESLLGLH